MSTTPKQNRIPRALSTGLEYAHNLRLQLGVAAGVRGALRVLRVLAAGRRPGEDPAAIGVPMKKLGGQELLVRPGTSDLRNASYYYTAGLYLPPPELDYDGVKQICELGSNMGAALTALAVRFPSATLLGVEPDPGNAEIARRNVARFGDRCALAETGIWDQDAELVVDRATVFGEHGFKVRSRTQDDPPDTPSISALSIDSLLARHMPHGMIDYLHMTIEGTEPRVLGAGGGWTDRVRSLCVEAHPDFGYPAPQVIADLERLGYSAWSRPDTPAKWVYALKG